MLCMATAPCSRHPAPGHMSMQHCVCCQHDWLQHGPLYTAAHLSTYEVSVCCNKQAQIPSCTCITAVLLASAWPAMCSRSLVHVHCQCVLSHRIHSRVDALLPADQAQRRQHVQAPHSLVHVHSQRVLRHSGQLLPILELPCSQCRTWHGVVAQDVHQRGLVCVEVGDLYLELQQRSAEGLHGLSKNIGGGDGHEGFACKQSCAYVRCMHVAAATHMCSNACTL